MMMSNYQHIFLNLFLVLPQLFPLIQGTVWQARTSVEFSRALQSSRPGDVIKLFRDTRYPGDFILPDKGASGAITIEGNGGGKVFGNSAEIVARGTGLDIIGGKWIIRSLSVEGGTVGISIHGFGHYLQTVSVSGSQKAIVVLGHANKFQTVTARGSSTGILVKGSGNTLQTVTAKATQGPGIEIMGDQNNLRTVTARGVGAGIVTRGNGNRMQTVTSNPPQQIFGNGNGGINFGSTHNRLNNYGGGTQNFRNSVFNTGARTGSGSSENVGTGSGNNFNNFLGNQDSTGALVSSGESSVRRQRRKNKGWVINWDF